MKILQLCHKPPAPPKDGGCIAMHTITEGLMKAGHEVTLLTIYTHKHDLELDKLSQEYIDQTNIKGIFVDTRVNLVDAFSTLITQDSYNVSRFFSTDFDIILTKLLQNKKYDIIHLESLFMTPYIGTIRRFSQAKVVLRSHNLEYIIWERVASGTKNFAKKAYLKYLSRQLKAYELDVITRMDGIVSISDGDQNHYRELGLKKPIVNIPFGIDMENYPLAEEPPSPTLFHLGAMDWTPNIEGVLWFLEEVWPIVYERHPELKLHLAGRKMPDHLMELDYPNVKIIGEVEDAKKFMRAHQIMIVPLLSAGGIRVKIIEGMALAKNIVSTSVGAEGIEAEHGADFIVVDEPEAFAEAISRLLSNAHDAEEMQKKARKRAEQVYDNKVLINQLVTFYEDLLSR